MSPRRQIVSLLAGLALASVVVVAAWPDRQPSPDKTAMPAEQASPPTGDIPRRTANAPPPTPPHRADRPSEDVAVSAAVRFRVTSHDGRHVGARIELRGEAGGRESTLVNVMGEATAALGPGRWLVQLGNHEQVLWIDGPAERDVAINLGANTVWFEAVTPTGQAVAGAQLVAGTDTRQRALGETDEHGELAAGFNEPMVVRARHGPATSAPVPVLRPGLVTLVLPASGWLYVTTEPALDCGHASQPDSWEPAPFIDAVARLGARQGTVLVSVRGLARGAPVAGRAWVELSGPETRLTVRLHRVHWEVRGAVRQFDGGVVPGVQVSLLRRGAGPVATTLTDQRGGFRLSVVPDCVAEPYDLQLFSAWRLVRPVRTFLGDGPLELEVVAADPAPPHLDNPDASR